MNRHHTAPTLLISAALFTLVADAVTAQGGRGGGRRRRPNPPFVEALDADRDGRLSTDEIDGATKTLLGLDKNADGNLVSSELAPPQRDAERRRRGGPPGGMMAMMMASHPLMKALDKDGDGELFEDEVTDAATSLRRLDADQSGSLEAEEFTSSGGGFGGRRGGFGRGSRDAAPQTALKPSQLKAEDGAATLPDRASFQALAYRGDEVLIDTHLAGHEFVKFQIQNATSDAPDLYFINTKTHRAHGMFSSAVGLPRRGGESMRGVLVYRPMLRAPDGTAGLYTFEFEPNDAYDFEHVQIAHRMLGEASALLMGRIAYNLLPASKVPYLEERALYEAAALPTFEPDAVYSDIAYLPLHQGVGFGTLKLMKDGERPSPRDIVLYPTLPSEMPRVAGIITGQRQTPLSHVNLRAVQDNVPNAFVDGAADNPIVRELVGQPVRYEVTDAGFELRAASAEEMESHFAALRPKAGQTPMRDLSVEQIRPFDELKFDDSKSVGVKAANLAVLHKLDLGTVETPDGFAVPFAFYDRFMKHNGFDVQVRALLSKPDFTNDASARAKALKKLRKAIKKGEMPANLAAQLAAVQASFPAGSSIRCRSSTNNEDLPGFSGAGLYDSFTHRPDEGHLSKSIQQVFASLWNFRAFEERAFYRVDHTATAMGVALHPNQKGEQVNGVAVTKDVLYGTAEENRLLYYVNAQSGEDLVTGPDAGSVPEELLLGPRNPKSDRLVRSSNRVENNQRLLNAETLLSLRRSMRRIVDAFGGLYGREDDAKFAMEIEFKITSGGSLLIKQARPWIDS